MKSIIDYIKEGLTPAELADMIEHGTFIQDDFDRWTISTPEYWKSPEKRQEDISTPTIADRAMGSLRWLTKTAKKNNLTLEQLVALIESRKTSGLDSPEDAPYKHEIDSGLKYIHVVLSTCHLKGFKDSHIEPELLVENALAIEFKPIPTNADDWCKVIYTFHNQHPQKDRPAVWQALYDGAKVRTTGETFTVTPDRNSIVLKETAVSLLKKNFNSRWCRYLITS